MATCLSVSPVANIGDDSGVDMDLDKEDTDTSIVTLKPHTSPLWEGMSQRGKQTKDLKM